MAVFQTPAIRHAVSLLISPLRCQRRWAQVHDVRFLATHMRPDRLLEKYKEKLDQKAKEKGLSNVDELKAAYEEKIKILRKQAVVPGASAPLQQPLPSLRPSDASIPFQPPPPPQPQHSLATAESKAGIKTLASFIDVEKSRGLPKHELETIWRLRHARDPQSLCALIGTDTYQRIAETAQKHPQFILPLPREGQGAEIHFLQWTFPSPTTTTVLFTHLAEYKLRGEFSQPHTTVTHHLDLSDSNGTVLLQGQVVEGRGVSVEEGKWLLMCLQKFYGFEAHSEPAKENAGKRKKLMKQFSEGDEGFKVEELVEEAERIP